VSHSSDAVKDELAATDDIPEPVEPSDIADSVAYMVTRPRRVSVAELWNMPTSQA
jgi:NADP-dependent 3-hydroxy acid dehydrogenase YdfG